MKNIINKSYYVIIFTVVFASAHLLALPGFEDERVLELLQEAADKTNNRASEIIEVVQDLIEDEDMVRFFVTLEGELFFLDGQGQLYAVITVPQAREAEGAVLICSSDIDALKVRSVGFAFVTEDIFGDDAKQDNFEFLAAANPRQALREFGVEYESMHPELEEAKRERKWLYGSKNLEPARKRTKADGSADL